MKKRIKAFTCIPNSVIRDPSISSVEFRILCCVASFNPSYPSYSVIQERTGLSRGSVSKAIKRLTERGFISYKRGSKLSGFSNKYTLNRDIFTSGDRGYVDVPKHG